MIIGIDVGTRAAGIAMLDDSGLRRWSSQIIIQGRALNDRLWYLFGEIDAAVRDEVYLGPVWAYIESPPYVQNHATHAALHQGVGIVKAALMHNMILPRNIHELTATEIKAAFTGNGRADKAEVQRVVKMQFGIDAGEDEADAIATAYAGHCKLREEALDADE